MKSMLIPPTPAPELEPYFPIKFANRSSAGVILASCSRRFLSFFSSLVSGRSGPEGDSSGRLDVDGAFESLRRLNAFRNEERFLGSELELGVKVNAVEADCKDVVLAIG